MAMCGACARNWCKWLKNMMSRRWGGLKFYEHAATSIKPPREDT